jgi:hypothetical protein
LNFKSFICSQQPPEGVKMTDPEEVVLKINRDSELSDIRKIIVNDLSVNEFKFIRDLAEKYDIIRMRMKCCPGTLEERGPEREIICTVEFEARLSTRDDYVGRLLMAWAKYSDVWYNVQPTYNAHHYRDYQFASFEEAHDVITKNNYKFMYSHDD